MSAPVHRFACKSCGRRAAEYPSAACPGCGAWDTYGRITGTRQAAAAAQVFPCIGKVPPIRRVPCGVSWVDAALAGGIEQSQRVLLGGAEGGGKSRLCLQASRGWADRGRRVLYVTGEMAVEQTKQAAVQLECAHRLILLTPATEVQQVVDLVRKVRPHVLVVDSLNALHDAGRRGSPGSPGQLTACLAALGKFCQARKIPSVFLAQLNGRDAVAGPRWLRHEVDAVAILTVDKHGNRNLRVSKNRQGAETSTDLVMTEKGLTTR